MGQRQEIAILPEALPRQPLSVNVRKIYNLTHQNLKLFSQLCLSEGKYIFRFCTDVFAILKTG